MNKKTKTKGVPVNKVSIKIVNNEKFDEQTTRAKEKPLKTTLKTQASYAWFSFLNIYC